MYLLPLMRSNLQIFLFGMIASCLLIASDASWAAAGAIQLVIGIARISQHHGQERSAARGDNLYEGDTVATGNNSNVQIRMLDEAIIWIRPNSEFTIDKYRSDQHGAAKNEASLRLSSGGIRQVTGMIGKSSPSDYKLKTPNAVIGIRGTEFDAMYATPQIAAQLNTPEGTYNRVYSGSTSLESASGKINLKKDEAGFMGVESSDKPQVLPRIPSFLNTNVSAPPENSGGAPPKAKSLLISVRYGEANSDSISSIGSRDTGTEQRVQAMEGERTTLTVMEGPAPRKAGQTGARPVTQTTFEVSAKVDGNSVAVKFFSQQQTASSSVGQATQVATSLSIPLGVWTEVSGRGPWSSSGNTTISSRDASGNPGHVYLKVDDISR